MSERGSEGGREGARDRGSKGERGEQVTEGARERERERGSEGVRDGGSIFRAVLLQRVLSTAV